MTAADLPGRDAPERRRVILHVGLPKCGSSYLQGILAAQRPSADLCTVQGSVAYRATRELLSTAAESGLAPAWQALATHASEQGSTTLISCELLAYANYATARRAVESFGDAEVHVVVVARDLASLLPSRWQQNVRTGRQESFEDFLDRVLGRDADTSTLNPAQVCKTWAASLRPDQVHLVTMPPHGSEYAELWRRFTRAADLDCDEIAPPEDRLNSSMGITSAELVRRLNAHFDRDAEPRAYGAMVKRVLAGRMLAGDSSPPAAIPNSLLPRAAAMSSRWCDEILQAGYDVTGSVEDLAVRPHEGGDPARVSESEVLNLALQAIASLLRENRAQARTIRRLRLDRSAAASGGTRRWRSLLHRGSRQS